MHKFNELFRSRGFYAVLALCLAAVGLWGYLLLFRGGGEAETPAASAETEQTVRQAAVSAPQEAVETALPAEIPETVPDPEPEPQPEPQPEETAPVSKPVTAVTPQPPALVVSPLSGQMVAAFSVDRLTYNATLNDWRTHDGIDIAAAPGTDVLAASAGTVLSVADDDLLGTTVIIGHSGGYQTTYASLQGSPTVRAGDHVSAGQIIGAVGTTSLIEGSSGPHLHFSVSKDGDLVDPEEYLKK
ncbi:M23 family metallopeptidase [Dysosmobacter sp.]|uniref:M23 family metallopeptidase n=1 Tax=Dysosmobacter sp. TaxID=2591382 RepID=UPI002A8C1A35|nr:M23 family metallopeptidase [Dysosmobacter sp.]MDY3281258.1 M23 family metallopeptidase [Dysosmobacter sp.]